MPRTYSLYSSSSACARTMPMERAVSTEGDYIRPSVAVFRNMSPTYVDNNRGKSNAISCILNNRDYVHNVSPRFAALHKQASRISMFRVSLWNRHDDFKFLSVPRNRRMNVFLDIASGLTLQIAVRFSAPELYSGKDRSAVTQLSGNHASRRKCTRGKYFYNTANGPRSPNGFSPCIAVL